MQSLDAVRNCGIFSCRETGQVLELKGEDKSSREFPLQVKMTAIKTFQGSTLQGRGKGIAYLNILTGIKENGKRD